MTAWDLRPGAIRYDGTVRVPYVNLAPALAAVSLVVLALALPAAALAHPGGHGQQAAPPIEEPQDSGGGMSPAAVVTISVGLFILACGRYALKKLQKRPASGRSLAANEPAAEPAPRGTIRRRAQQRREP
jgi:hypothetical protein